MPLTQPERDNPLMNRYFREINLPGKRLAKRCDVSHSQVYMARRRNVGPDNAEKISRGVANILGLSERERLELKAEIMGHPENLLWAWFGGPARASRLLKVPEPTAREILDPGKSITHKSGSRALDKLRRMEAPEFVIESVDRRLLAPPEPRRGLIAHDLHGAELSNRLRSTRRKLPTGKPLTYEAIQASGLTKKEIHERAGVGKEAMRQALYKRCGTRSAEAISSVLAEAASLSEGSREAIRQELLESPQTNS